MRGPHFRRHFQLVHGFSVQFQWLSIRSHRFQIDFHRFSIHFNWFSKSLHWVYIPFQWFSTRISTGAPRHQYSHLSSNPFFLQRCTCAGYARPTFSKTFPIRTLIFYTFSMKFYTVSLISIRFPKIFHIFYLISITSALVFYTFSLILCTNLNRSSKTPIQSSKLKPIFPAKVHLRSVCAAHIFEDISNWYMDFLYYFNDFLYSLIDFK